MGNSHYENYNNAEGDVQSEWRVKEKTLYMNIWCRKDNPDIELQEYQFYINDERQFLKQKGLYYLRKNHPNLVATHYFSQHQQKDLCASSFKGTIFIERIPLRLSNVTDIPFPDILHFYDQSIKALHLLSNQFGYFEIDENIFCINQQGVAKLWLNQQLQRCYPRKKFDNQFQMVLAIFKTLQKNTDPDTMPTQQPSITQFVYKNKLSEQVDFAFAQLKLRQYIDKFNNGKVPSKLQCFAKVGGTIAVAQKIRNPSTLIQNPGINNEKKVLSQQQIQANRKQNSDFYRHNGDRIGDIQLKRYRSVSPPILKVNQNNMYFGGYRVNKQIMPSGQQNSVKVLGSQSRIENHQFIRRQQGLIGSSVGKRNVGLNQSQISRNYGHVLQTQKAPQVQFIKQLQPKQVAVMEQIKLTSKKNIEQKQIIPTSSQITKLRKVTMGSHEWSSSTQKRQNMNRQAIGSDIFEARQVQASNIVQNSGPRNIEMESYKSKIGKQKPIYQSNFISENNEAFDINKLPSQTSNNSNNSQVQWRDYTHQAGVPIKQSGSYNHDFKKAERKIYEDQVFSSEARSSSSELLKELSQVRHKVNQEVSRSRHQAEKQAFAWVKNHPDQIKQIHTSQGNQESNESKTYTSFGSINSKNQYPPFSQKQHNQFLKSNSKQQRYPNGNLFEAESLSSQQKLGFDYQTSKNHSPQKSQQYHIQYDSQLLADLNALK